MTKKRKIRQKRKIDGSLSNLPSSVLQAGAIFLSIIIEALPFVLIGSIISGAIEVYVTPEKVYQFLLKIAWGESFWYLYRISLSFL